MSYYVGDDGACRRQGRCYGTLDVGNNARPREYANQHLNIKPISRKALAERHELERNAITPKQFVAIERQRQAEIQTLLGVPVGGFVKPQFGRNEVIRDTLKRGRRTGGGKPAKPVIDPNSPEPRRPWPSVAACASELKTSQEAISQACRRSAKWIATGKGKMATHNGRALMFASDFAKLATRAKQIPRKPPRTAKAIIDVLTQKTWPSNKACADATGISPPNVQIGCAKAKKDGWPARRGKHRLMYLEDWNILRAKLLPSSSY